MCHFLFGKFDETLLRPSLRKFTKFNKVYMIYSFYVAFGSKFSTVGLSSAAEPLSIFRLPQIVLKVELA